MRLKASIMESFFGILLLGAFLFSVTKYLHDTHLSLMIEPPHDKITKERFSQPKKSINVPIDNGSEQTYSTIVPRVKEAKLTRHYSPIVYAKVSSTAKLSYSPSSPLIRSSLPPLITSDSNEHGQRNVIISKSHVHSPVEQKCSVESPLPKCTISSRLMQYWETKMDCFCTPLRPRNPSPLKLPPQDRKYVVMQPDLGGWNNIRMALEVGLLFAHATGRIFVIPPPAVLYLLHQNKKWKDNFSTFADFLDFNRLGLDNGLEIITMKEFLTTVAAPGLLSKPLPENNTDLIKQPLWDYLESACYSRPWEIGKSFIAFNFNSSDCVNKSNSSSGLGSIDFININQSDRFQRFNLNRTLVPYDKEFHSHRAIYFPGHENNRLLTHFYAYLYFVDDRMDRLSKRFVRDRMRYVDVVYCVAGQVIDEIHRIQSRNSSSTSLNRHLLSTYQPKKQRNSLSPILNEYAAYHIRRGDFQHKHTQISADEILSTTAHLFPAGRGDITLYIATDEKNVTHVLFLSDFQQSTEILTLNPNHIGMVEQLVCANAFIFIGCPLSTFTGYITRIRGYMSNKIQRSFPGYNDVSPPLNVTVKVPNPTYNKKIKDSTRFTTRNITIPYNSIYSRTFYYMNQQMYQLHTEHHLSKPFWVRDFVEPFESIDESPTYAGS